jgi:hypothetical protein
VTEDISPRVRIMDACLGAVTWIEELDRADAAWAVELVIDAVIDALREDASIPRRTLDEWTLFFADVRAGAEDELALELNGKADLQEVVDAIVDELVEEETGAGGEAG